MKVTLKNEFAGGLNAAVIGLPTAIAFGIQSGLGAETGIYAAILLTVVTCFFAASKGTISDPVGPITIVATLLVSAAITVKGNLQAAFPAIIVCFLFAGLMQIGLGFLKVAKYMRYISYPVLSGFMSAIGVLIILYQWNAFTGHTGPKDVISILAHFHEPLLDPDWNSILLGTVCLALIYLLPQLSRKIPAGITALVITTILSFYIEPTFRQLGDIPAKFPDLRWREIFAFDWRDLPLILPFSITIAGLGAINSLLTAIAADSRTKQKTRGNLELIAQGSANIVSGLFGGLPGSAGAVGTLANVNAGGRTRISGFIKSGVLIIMVVGLGQFLKYIPIPVIAALLISTGIRIIDFKGIRKLAKIRNNDLLVLSTVLLLAILADLLVAIGVGMILSSFFFMQQMGNLVEERTKYGELSDMNQRLKIPKFMKEGIYVMELDGPLFYGFSDEFKTVARKVKGKRAVIINMSGVPYIDASGIFMLEEVITEFKQVGVEVVLVGVKEQIFKNFEDLKLIPKVLPEENVYNRIGTGVKYLSQKLAHEI